MLSAGGMLNRALLTIAMIFKDHKCTLFSLNVINISRSLDLHHLYKTACQYLHRELHTQKKQSFFSNSTSKRLI